MGFMKLVGDDEKEQVRGIVSVVVFCVIIVVLFLLVVDPAFGRKVSEKTINMEIVSALISIITLCLGYLAGERGKASRD